MDEFDVMDDDDGEEGGGEWMATFADLSTLLLTFFVLLLSFANMDVVNFRMALGSVKDALGVQAAHPGSFEGVMTSPIQFSLEESASTVKVIDEMALLKEVKALIDSEGMSSTMDADLDDRGVVVRVKGALLFRPGHAKLQKDSVKSFKIVATMARKVKSQLMIEGHTDPRPIRNKRFASNWELSTARAIAAMKMLVQDYKVDPARIAVAGYAHMRPIASNKTPQGRARNRRVEFVFMSAKGESLDSRKSSQGPVKGSRNTASGGVDLKKDVPTSTK